ncbi:MAG: hypothetical protein GY740_18615, partial [Gammaproteobacteria bacterium]|nr:hypothetical protein [Gammaproteobacteria bacterium]
MNLAKYKEALQTTFSYTLETPNHVGLADMASDIHINIDHLSIVTGKRAIIQNMNALIHNPITGKSFAEWNFDENQLITEYAPALAAAGVHQSQRLLVMLQLYQHEGDHYADHLFDAFNRLQSHLMIPPPLLFVKTDANHSKYHVSQQDPCDDADWCEQTQKYLGWQLAVGRDCDRNRHWGMDPVGNQLIFQWMAKTADRVNIQLANQEFTLHDAHAVQTNMLYNLRLQVWTLALRFQTRGEGTIASEQVLHTEMRNLLQMIAKHATEEQ